MASITKFHVASCSGKDCNCLRVLDYGPLGLFGPRRRVRFKTRKQAERFQIDTAQKASRGEYVEPAKVPTFGEVAEDWFRSKSDRRPSHTFNLRTRLDKQILPVIGKQKLDRSPSRKWKNFVTSCARKSMRIGRLTGYSGSSVRCFASQSNGGSTRGIRSTASRVRFSRLGSSAPMVRRLEREQTRSIPTASSARRKFKLCCGKQSRDLSEPSSRPHI